MRLGLALKPESRQIRDVEVDHRVKSDVAVIGERSAEKTKKKTSRWTLKMLPAEVQRELLYRASTGSTAYNTTSFYRDPAATSHDRSLASSFCPGDVTLFHHSSIDK